MVLVKGQKSGGQEKVATAVTIHCARNYTSISFTYTPELARFAHCERGNTEAVVYTLLALTGFSVLHAIYAWSAARRIVSRKDTPGSWHRMTPTNNPVEIRTSGLTPLNMAVPDRIKMPEKRNNPRLYPPRWP